MTPAAFRFHLSVPRDASLVPILRDLAAHAAAYARMASETSAAFTARVTAAGERALGAEPGACPVDFACADGVLLVTIGGESISQRVTA